MFILHGTLDGSFHEKKESSFTPHVQNLFSLLISTYLKEIFIGQKTEQGQRQSA